MADIRRIRKIEDQLQPKQPVSYRIIIYDDLDGTSYIESIIENAGTPEQYTRQPTPEELERYGSEDNPLMRTPGNE